MFEGNNYAPPRARRERTSGVRAQLAISVVVASLSLMHHETQGSMRERADNIQFTRPAGWQRIDNADGSVILVPPNQDRRHVMLLIATGVESKGADIEDWYNYFWSLTLKVNQARPVNGGQGIRQRIAGVDTISTSALLRKSDGSDMHVDLMTAAPGMRLEALVFMARNADLYREHRTAVRKLWQNIRFANLANDAPAGSGTSARATQSPTPSAASNRPRIHRIYRGVEASRGFMATGDYGTAHYLLFTNGLIYRKTIMTGPADVDPNTLDPDDVGTSKIVGDGVAIVWSWGGEQMLHKRLFAAVPSVDGMKLQGRYRYEMAGGEVAWIEFTPDGRFRDQGVINSDMFGTSRIPGRNGRPPAGSGTYQIRDYTLFLQHENGALYRATFYALPESKSQPGKIVVNTYELTH